MNDDESDANVATCETSDFPDCWNEEQYKYFTSEDSWLEVKNKFIGCRVCCEISALGMGTQRGAGIKFSKEWVECKVNRNGDNKIREQSSLRKQLIYTRLRFSHKACEPIKTEGNKKYLAKTVDNMNSKYLEMVRIFRTAYKIAKQDRPFTDFPFDVQLQELNGLNMDRILQSNFSCANILDHIIIEMRGKIAETIEQY